MAQWLIPLVVIAVVFAVRVRRMGRARPLKLGQLWVVPALYAVMVAVAFVEAPPSPLGWAAALAGLAVGAAIGWWRGKTVAIHVDPDTGTLMQRASPLGFVILFALVLAKTGAKSVGQAEGLDVAVITDLLLAMALGTFVAMRLEMYARARRLLAAN